MFATRTKDRSSPSQARVAAVAGVARSTVARVLNGYPNSRIPAETCKRIREVAKKMGYDFSNLRRIYRRASPRVDVGLSVAVTIHTRRGRVYDEGEARIATMNSAGLLLRSLDFPKRSLPTEPFTFWIRLSRPRSKSIELQCEPIHLAHGKELAIGARFIGASGRVGRSLWGRLTVKR